MKYHIRTFGCQMNLSDSERVATVLERLGYEAVPREDEADLLIFNTCSVRQKAEDRVLGLRPDLQKLHEQNHKLKVGITGCMVRKSSTQVSPGAKDELLRTLPEVALVFRIEELAKLPDLLKESDPELKFTDELDEGTLENYFKIAPKKTSDFSVFVPIQSGCDKMCTYCIVPFTRGREQSRGFQEVLDECERHVREGAIEITLVGQTVNTYGLSYKDRKAGSFDSLGSSPFSQLLKELDQLHELGLRRLRFTSPHPRDFSDEVIDTLASMKTACPYIHMPVQSGDDRTLRRMNRNYTVAEYTTIMKKIQDLIPGCAISTDIIVGFCGETDDEFENTYRTYEELRWDMCYLARYSPRRGTYAIKQLEDDIPYVVKAKRWHLMNELLKKIAGEKHAVFPGRTLEVLIHSQVGEHCIGRSREFKEVHVQSGRPLLGKEVSVLIEKAGNWHLEGVLV